MGIVLRTLGASTYSPFTSAASGTDYVSSYDPNDDYVGITGAGAPLTGAIGDPYSRPILYSYLQIFSSAGSSGTIDLQIATADTGAGGTHSPITFPITTANNGWNISDSSNGLAYPAFARQTIEGVDTNIRHYYGFQKNDSNTFTFRRGATASSSYNPNGIYQDGTSVTTGSPAWSTTVIYGRIRFYTVPTAPNSFTSSSQTSSSIALSWSAPTDPGAMDILASSSTIYDHHNVYGYRILTSTDNSTWYVYGAGTSGSPSGHHDVAFGTGSPSAPTSGTVTSHNDSDLVSNTNYYFKIAALNVTTDSHTGATVTPFASRSFGNYSSTAAHTGTNADLGPVRTKLATPTVTGSYTSVGYVNAAYSSNVTWEQPTGGGANTNYALDYTIASGSLPTGLSLNATTGAITGTPTTPGAYTFTITATQNNGDGGSVTSSSQTITVGTLGPNVVPTDGTPPTSRATVKIHNGTEFVTGKMLVYNGSTWTYLK